MLEPDFLDPESRFAGELLPVTVESFLDNTEFPYGVIPHAPAASLNQASAITGIDPAQLLRAIVLVDGKGLVMVVLPVHHLLDFEALYEHTGRLLDPVPAARLGALFEDCDLGTCPPLGPAYGLPVLVDQAIDSLNTIYLEPGRTNCLVAMRSTEFLTALGKPETFALSSPALRLAPEGKSRADERRSVTRLVEKFTPASARRISEDIHQLPQQPETARELVRYLHSDERESTRLEAILDLDCQLVAQLSSWARFLTDTPVNSATQNELDPVRLLGQNMTAWLGLALATLPAIPTPPDGPLGQDAFLRHAAHAACMSYELATQITEETLLPEIACSAGLLHNTGILVLGHAFPAEFYLLNRLLNENPDRSGLELEAYTLGVQHDHIGGWLLEAWGMPNEVVASARFHHSADITDSQSRYPALVRLANALLDDAGIPDPAQAPAGGPKLDTFGLELNALNLIVDRVLSRSTAIDELARNLAFQKLTR